MQPEAPSRGQQPPPRGRGVCDSVSDHGLLPREPRAPLTLRANKNCVHNRTRSRTGASPEEVHTWPHAHGTRSPTTEQRIADQSAVKHQLPPTGWCFPTPDTLTLGGEAKRAVSAELVPVFLKTRSSIWTCSPASRYLPPRSESGISRRYLSTQAHRSITVEVTPCPWTDGDTAHPRRAWYSAPAGQ